MDRPRNWCRAPLSRRLTACSEGGEYAATLPAGVPEPFQCGLLWFLHIGKTGGTTVTSHFREMAVRSNATFLHLYSADHLRRWSDWNSSAAAADAPSVCEARDCGAFCCIERIASQWEAVATILRDHPSPRVIVVQHHSSAGFGEWIVDGLLAPLRESLASRSCDVRTATVLRHPTDYVTSRLSYSLRGWMEGKNAAEVKRSGLAPTNADEAARALLTSYAQGQGKPVANLTQDPQTTYLMKGTHPPRKRTWCPHSAAAAEQLSRIDLVGRTAELDAFMDTANAMMGWPRTPAELRNPTRDEYKEAVGRQLREAGWTMDPDCDWRAYSQFCRVPGSPP